MGGGGLGVQPGQGLCTQGEPGEARHQCGELTLRDSRWEHQAGGWDRAQTKRRGTTRGRTQSGVPEWGHGWECWRKGGTSEQKGKDSLFFRSFVKPTVKSEQAVPKTTLPSDTICKLGEVPQSTIMFSNSLEGIPEHTVGCYTRGYGLLQGRDAG